MSYSENRPWGHFSVLAESQDYKLKELRVNPHSILSLQSHEHRNEYWVLIKGNGVANIDGSLQPILPGRAVYVQAGQKHRIENCTDEELVLIEVQTGDSFEESDITRYEDVYDRV